MAHILPDAPLSSCTPEAARLYRLLKRLPDEHFAVWQRLTIWTEPGPDFWVLRPDGRSVLIKVATVTPRDVRVSIQGQLFDPVQSSASRSSDPVGDLQQFVERITVAQGADFWRKVPGRVICPNLEAGELAEWLKQQAPPDGLSWLSKEQLTPAQFEPWLNSQLGPALSREWIAALRRAFTPEVIIPASFTVRKPLERHTAAELTEYLLDVRQEHVLKSDLELSDEAQAAAGEFGLRLVNGVAGSGKSLIVVYRAHLLHRLYPDKSILVLTHNRPLIRDLEARYQLLSQNGRGVEWRTFLAWCRNHWPRAVPWRDPLGQKRRQQIITQIWHTHLADTAISERMLQDEIDWFKDRALFTRADYLAADRTGRGFALAEALRQRVYTAIEAYEQALQRQQAVDWNDVPRRLWQSVQAGQMTLPRYDVVLIDEAQFFAPIWFEIIKRLVKTGIGHLFLAADPTQGFMKRGQSWRASGLEVRGRTHKMEKSYRTTREILNFATLLYRTRLPEDDEEILAPSLLDMPSGLMPIIVPLTSSQDEVSRVVNEVRELLKGGVVPGDILIIHADWLGVEHLTERLRREVGASAVIDPKDAPKGNQIRVVTLNAATGLESPIVFLCGVHQLYEEEQSVRLSEDERAELIRDNTRRLYMAITRAGQQLVLTYVGELPDILKQLGTIA